MTSTSEHSPLKCHDGRWHRDKNHALPRSISLLTSYLLKVGYVDQQTICSSNQIYSSLLHTWVQTCSCHRWPLISAANYPPGRGFSIAKPNLRKVHVVNRYVVFSAFPALPQLKCKMSTHNQVQQMRPRAELILCIPWETTDFPGGYSWNVGHGLTHLGQVIIHTKDEPGNFTTFLKPEAATRKD